MYKIITQKYNCSCNLYAKQYSCSHIVFTVLFRKLDILTGNIITGTLYKFRARTCLRTILYTDVPKF